MVSALCCFIIAAAGYWYIKGITDTKKASCCHIINQGLAIISLLTNYKIYLYKVVSFSSYPSRSSNWSFFIYRSFGYNVNNILGVSKRFFCCASHQRGVLGKQNKWPAYRHGVLCLSYLSSSVWPPILRQLSRYIVLLLDCALNHPYLLNCTRLKDC